MNTHSLEIELTITVEYNATAGETPEQIANEIEDAITRRLEPGYSIVDLESEAADPEPIDCPPDGDD